MASKLFQKVSASILFAGAMFFSLDNAIIHDHDHYLTLGFETVEYETKSPWIGKREKYDIVENIEGNKILYDVQPKLDYRHLLNGTDKNYKVSEVVYFGDTFEFNKAIPKSNLKESAEERANYLINAKNNAYKHYRLDSFMKENAQSLIELHESVKNFKNSSFL